MTRGDYHVRAHHFKNIEQTAKKMLKYVNLLLMKLLVGQKRPTDGDIGDAQTNEQCLTQKERKKERK